MKKATAILMAFALMLGLAACSGAGSSSSSQNASQAENAQTSEPENTPSSVAEEEPAQEPGAETGKTLVVYYSATGNTEEAANYIAEITGGDLFELEPADPYTDEDLNYSDEDSRVVHEHDNPEERNVELVADTVENWDTYDTVFIGYPIWWGTMPMAMLSFLERCSLSGKRILPFCTNEGSGMGNSERDLKEICKGARVEGGLSIHGAEAANSRSRVEGWLRELQ